jgi:hypothetical protein
MSERALCDTCRRYRADYELGDAKINICAECAFRLRKITGEELVEKFCYPDGVLPAFRANGEIHYAYRQSTRNFDQILKSNGISKAKRFAILHRDGFRCRYCGISSKQTQLEIDHVIPSVKGGSNKDDNLVTACKKCNAGKGTMSLEVAP